MSGDFRTQAQERKVARRLAYLEELLSSGTSSEAERRAIETEIRIQSDLLHKLQDEDALIETSVFETIVGEVSPHRETYVPSLPTLELWRSEARERLHVVGESDDEPRRILVLIDAIMELQAHHRPIEA